MTLYDHVPILILVVLFLLGFDELDIGTVESGYIIHGIYHPAAYIGHFRSEPNFYIRKTSGYIIQPCDYIGHFERCERRHLRA